MLNSIEELDQGKIAEGIDSLSGVDLLFHEQEMESLYKGKTYMLDNCGDGYKYCEQCCQPECGKRILKPYLNEEEREYLEHILKPFKYNVKYIKKCSKMICGNSCQYIVIKIISKINDYVTENIELPCFENKEIYKGLQIFNEYTLEDLELFKA